LPTKTEVICRARQVRKVSNCDMSDCNDERKSRRKSALICDQRTRSATDQRLAVNVRSRNSKTRRFASWVAAA
jgi:hypothetical protein